MQQKNDFLRVVKQTMVAIFYGGSQIGRSIKGIPPNNRIQFKKALLASIMDLTNEADKGTLKNKTIRKEIAKLSKMPRISVGQAQKVVNVYLKFYCILKEQDKLIVELDCPIDSGIAEKVWEGMSKEDRTKFFEIYDMKAPLDKKFYKQETELTNLKYPVYLFLQRQLQKTGKGVRVSCDIETYDKKRIQGFVSSLDNDE